MNRKLDFNSTKSERKMAAARLAPDAPPFNLDTLSDEEIFVEDEDDQGAKVYAANNDSSKENVGPSRDSITPVAQEYERGYLRLESTQDHLSSSRKIRKTTVSQSLLMKLMVHSRHPVGNPKRKV
jgi:hypothetical protein